MMEVGNHRTTYGVKRFRNNIRKKSESPATLIDSPTLSHSAEEIEIRNTFMNEFAMISSEFGLRQFYITTDEPANYARHRSEGDLWRIQLSESSGLLASKSVDVIQATYKRLGEILNEQREIRSAVRIQGIVRGWLVRKRMKLVLPFMESIKYTRVLFIGLVNYEKKYISDLKVIIQLYLIPMRSKASATEDFHAIATIFCNIEQILGTHITLLRELLHIREQYWPFVQDLGRVFIQHASEFKSYGDYAENLVSAQSTLKAVYSSKKYSHLRETVDNYGGMVKLQSLISQPVSHIGKYSKILESFASVRDGFQPEELDILSRAQAIMDNICDLVNAKLKSADRVSVLQEIQRSVIFENKPITLQNETRCFVEKGVIHCVTLKKIQYFLFNDLLVLSKTQGEKFKVLHAIDLVDASLDLVECDNGKYQVVFELAFPNEKLQFLVDPVKGGEHLERIRKQIFKHKKMGVIFGISLEEILTRENRHPVLHNGNGIPSIVEYIINYLKAHGLKREGLLRHPGAFERIKKLQKQFDNASLKSYDHINMDNCDVHDVAAVLRLYFRELPSPVIPFSFYEPLMEIQRNAGLSLEERVNSIKRIILEIPPLNMPLLKYLIQFLQAVEEHSYINRMTVSNLAIVFGPNIIRAEVETVQNALEMPLLQGIIQILIEHSDSIWEIEKPNGPRNKPLSVLFVGRELTPLIQSSNGVPAAKINMRASGNAIKAYLLAINNAPQKLKDKDPASTEESLVSDPTGSSPVNSSPINSSPINSSPINSSPINSSPLSRGESVVKTVSVREKLKQLELEASKREEQRKRLSDDMRKSDLEKINAGGIVAKRRSGFVNVENGSVINVTNERTSKPMPIPSLPLDKLSDFDRELHKAPSPRTKKPKTKSRKVVTDI